jgi:8-oxo-dGTP pyrophosphatase MutT (NUDIX family)
MVAEVITLHENAWVSLRQASDWERGVHGYVYSHETRCDGKIVAVLPYLKRHDGDHEPGILLHSENNPAWDWGPNLAAVTGGQETEWPAVDAAREIREETGYQVTAVNLAPLGTCRGVKSTDTVYSLFAADLAGSYCGDPEPGSLLEASEHSEWATWGEAITSPDPLVSVMMLRLQGIFRGGGSE